MTTIAITADRGIPKNQLDKLAKQTSLPLLDKNTQADYLLHITTEYLELRKIDNSAKKPKIESIHVDFLAGKTNHRRLHGGGKGQDLAKAIGLHKIKNATVLDLTAGMGGDAFVLATLGANVTLIERNPVTHALLYNAFSRANLTADNELQEIFSRMTLKNEDALSTLGSLEQEVDSEVSLPDVIYIDPMFPVRNKSAQVKKEMQFFHDIIGDDNDSEALLLKSLSCANKRIVVKRPRLAEALTQEIEANFSISGKSTRYDIYLPREPSLSD